MLSPYRKQWSEAEKEKLDSLRQHDVYDVVCIKIRPLPKKESSARAINTRSKSMWILWQGLCCKVSTKDLEWIWEHVRTVLSHWEPTSGYGVDTWVRVDGTAGGRQGSISTESPQFASKRANGVWNQKLRKGWTNDGWLSSSLPYTVSPNSPMYCSGR